MGAEIDIRAVRVGDDTLSVMEIWGAEYQENDCLLIKPESRQLLQSICDRERTFLQVCRLVQRTDRAEDYVPASLHHAVYKMSLPCPQMACSNLKRFHQLVPHILPSLLRAVTACLRS